MSGMQLSLADAAKLLTGTRVVGDAAVTMARVHSDTRTLQPGDLFVALRGARFDAHDFGPQARAQGAVAVVAELIAVRRQRAARRESARCAPRSRYRALRVPPHTRLAAPGRRTLHPNRHWQALLRWWLPSSRPGLDRTRHAGLLHRIAYRRFRAEGRPLSPRLQAPWSSTLPRADRPRYRDGGHAESRGRLLRLRSHTMGKARNRADRHSQAAMIAPPPDRPRSDGRDRPESWSRPPPAGDRPISVRPLGERRVNRTAETESRRTLLRWVCAVR